MIFYVYLAPEIIKLAYKEGSQSIQILIGILRGLSQNCFLADFDNSYVQNEIHDLLSELLGEYDVIILKKLLVHFSKQNLFVNCFEYDYAADAKELDMVVRQFEENSIDLLLLTDADVISSNLPVEAATISNYQISNFEPLRSKFARDGITLPAKSLEEYEFFKDYLLKALKYARSIEIFDYLCGEKHNNNYAYTLKKFLGWLRILNKEDLTITLHCGYPEANSDLFERDELNGLRADEIEPKKKEKLTRAINSYYGKTAINVICYDTKFAHDRYVVTDQIAFTIGIGMDFLDTRGKIRDLSINLKDAQEVKLLVSAR